MTIRADASLDEPHPASSGAAAETVLVTGGAGFIGVHVTRELLNAGYEVRVLDALLDQVHGSESGDHDPDPATNGSVRPSPPWPAPLPDGAVRIEAHVEDRFQLRRALEGVDAVIHLAARVGVGQSMYRVADYVRGNAFATAALLEELVERGIRRLVVASSMSVYGEGACAFADGRPAPRVRRSEDRLRRACWEPLGSNGEPLRSVPTDETVAPDLASVYALTKLDQERLCLLAGEAYDIPTVALRLFNVYGPYQALSNPYTGVLAIFGARLLNGRPPLVFEDGRQRRDFVHVSDVARAFRLALEAPVLEGEERVINIGSGESRTIREVGRRMAALLERPDLEPRVTGRYRRGDVRHCYAAIDRARRLLGFQPRVTFDEGLSDLSTWLRSQRARDEVPRATRELVRRGLVV